MSRATFLAAFKKAVIDYRAGTLCGRVGADGHLEIETQWLLADVSESAEDLAEEINVTRKYFEEIRCWVEAQTDIDAIVRSMREEDMADFTIGALLRFIKGLQDVMCTVTTENRKGTFVADVAELDRLEAEAQAFEDSVAAQRLGHKGGSNV